MSEDPPISAVLPSADSATLRPKRPSPASSPPVIFGPCWVHFPSERVKTHVAPTFCTHLPASPSVFGSSRRLSRGLPTSAVFPSAESAMARPQLHVSPSSPGTSPQCSPAPSPPCSEPTSLEPCWTHSPDPERTNTHTAPKWLLSRGPPISAVLPSAE